MVVGKNVLMGALYHPPRSSYKTEELLDYVETCVEEISHDFPAAHIVLAGDLNQLVDEELTARTGLVQIVYQPTRGTNILDRIFVSNPYLYSKVRVVTSVVRSDHKAVVAFSDDGHYVQQKTKIKRTYRRKSPAQHAVFLDCVANMNFNNPNPTASADPSVNTQAEFDYFYKLAIELLNQYYPERTITLTSRDPDYVTPEIKAMLRRKNKLMRSGRVEEAGALAGRIGKEITRRNKGRLITISSKNSKDLWATVRQLTGRQQDEGAAVDGVTAESLNDHYAAISSDDSYSYTPHHRRQFISADLEMEYVNEWRIFNLLDQLCPTATGLDGLPAWFLRLGAPVFCKPVAYLFNLSISTSTAPVQWKQARIRPVPKLSNPKQHADYRPISVTPVLARVMEKTVVQTFLYPAFLSPPPTLNFSDQFAFRPTGSTTACIINLINMLLSNPYVTVISLDFTKAFDTVRHSALFEKNLISLIFQTMSTTAWIVDVLSGRSHCTVGYTVGRCRCRRAFRQV